VRHVERLQAQLSFVQVNEGMAIRNLIEIGLETVEARSPQSPIPRQAPETLEPAPPLVTHETLTPEPDAQLPLTQEPAVPVQPSGTRARGRRSGTMRPRILTLLSEHPEGLSSEQIRVHLNAEKPIGDVLQGMRRAGVVQLRGEGYQKRYFLASEQARASRRSA
jgi:hypothetical protein